MRVTAAQKQAQRFAAFKQERKQEEQERRDQVVAEFDGDVHWPSQRARAPEGW
jgi:hypothetical protein